MMTFWQGKRVFLTGHTGFKGSWLALWLQCLQADVIGFSLEAPTTPNLFTLANVADNMTSIIGDIRDFQLLQKQLIKFRPDIIIHMAAQSLVRYSYQEPLETYTTNVLGTLHLLEAIKQIDSIKAVINVTSDKCYENKELNTPFKEDDRLGGYDPYSNSKACSELVTAAYQSSYFNGTHHKIGLASARAGNVIGGGDWAQDRLVPDIIHACINKQPVSIRFPQALRPWQHVLNPLSGYLLLAERLYASPTLYAGAWNFGPNEDEIKSVSWIANYLMKQWGSQLENGINIQNHNPQLHEAHYLKLDCTKAKLNLGWQPQWSLEDGLKETVKWYKAFHEKEDMHKVTLNQIQHFMRIKHPIESYQLS